MAGSILGGSTQTRLERRGSWKTVEKQSVQPARSDGQQSTPRPPSLRARRSRCVALVERQTFLKSIRRLKTSPSRSGRTRQS